MDVERISYFEIWDNKKRGKARRFFWHLKGENHEIVCAGEPNGYHNEAGARHGIELTRDADKFTPINRIEKP